MNENKTWEVDTCRGYFNNVFCVIFHERQDFILSNVEDKSIRVRNMTKRNIIYYVKEKYLRRLEITTSKDIPLMQLQSGPRALYYSISYNRAENSILLTTHVPHMVRIAKLVEQSIIDYVQKKDCTKQFQIAMLLGDVEKHVKRLRQSRHGLDEQLKE
ncbi:unnamed protein product [Rotaria sp. Silwood1]|nr:unnamed protein product [Rotaria sp. Silwood1]